MALTPEQERELTKLGSLKGDELPDIPSITPIRGDPLPSDESEEAQFEMRDGIKIIRDEGQSTGYEGFDQKRMLEEIGVLLRGIGDKLDGMAEGE